jgi:hypothetical protein
MLNRLKRMRIVRLRVVADPTMSHADLQIHSLLDNPDLRRAMGLDGDPELTAEQQDADQHDAGDQDGDQDGDPPDGDPPDAIGLEAIRVA